MKLFIFVLALMAAGAGFFWFFMQPSPESGTVREPRAVAERGEPDLLGDWSARCAQSIERLKAADCQTEVQLLFTSGEYTAEEIEAAVPQNVLAIAKAAQERAEEARATFEEIERQLAEEGNVPSP